MMKTPTFSVEYCPLAAHLRGLQRRAVGKAEPADRLVPFRKGWDAGKEAAWLAKIESEWDQKKRGKAAGKDAKKRAKLQAKANKKNSDMAAVNAQIARRRLNMGKAFDRSDMVTIAKSILSGGGAAQPATTSAVLVREIQKRGTAAFPDLSAAQAFAKYCGSADGAVLLKASRAAVQAPMTDWDDDADDDDDDAPDPAAENGDAYSRLSAMARQRVSDRPGLSFPVAFAQCYQAHPELAEMTKAHHAARLRKAWMPASATHTQETATAGSGSPGAAAPSFDRYQRLMAEAKRTRRDGQTLAERLAELRVENNPGAAPTGRDRSTGLQGDEPMTALRPRTAKSYNAVQRPFRLPGSEGWSR
jgi:hypothetical protein